MKFSVELYKGRTLGFTYKDSNPQLLHLKIGRFIHFFLMYYGSSQGFSFQKYPFNYKGVKTLEFLYHFLRVEYKNHHLIIEINKQNKSSAYSLFMLLLTIEEKVSLSSLKDKDYICCLFDDFVNNRKHNVSGKILEKCIGMINLPLSREMFTLICPYIDSEKIIYSDLPSDHEISMLELHKEER